MINRDLLRVLSFNCHGVSDKLPIINDLCCEASVVLLQETWLLPHNLSTLNSVNAHFNVCSISAVDVGVNLVGRPYGGVSIMWRKDLDSSCTIIRYGDPRLLGLCLKLEDREILLINVYLPYFAEYNRDEYLLYIGKILSIIEDAQTNHIFVVGDFNAKTGGIFYQEWLKALEGTDMLFSDVNLLPQETFTHVNNASMSRSWLDHCLAAASVHSCVSTIRVDSSYYGSDHYPLIVNLDLGLLPKSSGNEHEQVSPKIRWDFKDVSKTRSFYENLSQKFCQGLPNLGICDSIGCTDAVHIESITHAWETFISEVITAGKEVFGTLGTSNRRNIPGWNSYVRGHYDLSRQAFLAWKNANSPREGDLARDMRQKRALFKLALKRCKVNESQMRADALARKLMNGQCRQFWADIKSVEKTAMSLPTRIDAAIGRENICALWRERFSSRLNSVDDCSDRDVLISTVQETDHASIMPVTIEELVCAIDSLSANKAAGIDLIPLEFYSEAPVILLRWLVELFNKIFLHSFVPVAMTDVMIIPILKSNLKDSSDSENYRPIAVSNSISKILEKCMLNRLGTYLQTSDNQFGFKRSHSTETCIFALKQVLNYYRDAGSPVFVCFLDIKSAFDRVSHNKLFLKLLDRGVPKYLLSLLIVWYGKQQLYISWAGIMSSSFNMTNGIRQGSLISPLLFSLYLDEMSLELNTARIGCHIGGHAMNHLAYADDLVLLAPSAVGLNRLLQLSKIYADENYIKFSASKTVCMLILPSKLKIDNRPKIYIGSDVVEYVSEFRYLGHIVSNDLCDDKDIARETRSLYCRGNAIVRKFNFCTVEVKTFLFKSYCYSLYTCSVWSSFNKKSLYKLKVAYNNIMRMLSGVPRWESIRGNFVRAGIFSFDELLRMKSFSLMERIRVCPNELVRKVVDNDRYSRSRQKIHWDRILSVNS